MATFDHLSKTIEAFYSASTGEVEWSDPLAQLTDLCGGAAATLELVDLEKGFPIFFQADGIDPASADDYIDHFQLISPRIGHGMRANSPDIGCDYQFMSEQEMDGDAFYSDYLTPLGIRYYVSGTLVRTTRRFGLFSIQRNRRQGHVDKDEVALVDQVLPHIRRALDLFLRLEDNRDYARQLGHALDQHSDGLVLIGHDGSVLHANRAARKKFRRKNGLGICRNQLEFADRSAKKFLDSILQAMADKASQAPWPETEFFAAKKSGGLPYAISVYPAHTLQNGRSRNYLAILFLRDLDRQQHLSRSRVQKILGLTPAETRLAVWIGKGRMLEAYARRHDVSMNTVYTHFRHLKDKAGCGSQMALVAKIRQIAVLGD